MHTNSGKILGKDVYIYFLSSLFINYKMYVELILLEQDAIEKLLSTA